ncbi:hypothetical protein Tco_0860548 [Tanacetum coccineum]|uniref:Uncharacterized protein n=1 Tax=Tanacetum coccineum TaxID=301880 RepID=A0ABQ5BF80_9ASTR
MADDQPMWGNNRAVAPTPGAAIIAVDLEDNLTIKGHHLSMIKDLQFDGRARANRHKHIAEFVKIYGCSDMPILSTRTVRPTHGRNSRFHPKPNESLVDAWLRMKDLLRSCHGHGLGRGTIIQIFYHGLDEAMQAILDARGIFLHKTPNDAQPIAREIACALKPLSKDMKSKPIRKTVAFTKSSNDSKLMENMEALTTKIDSQFKDIKE